MNVVASRLTAQLLTRPSANDPADVAEHLLAIQAQDLRGAQLAVRARSKGLSVGDIDRALTTDRSVVITWLNRGTLHLVRVEDYWWLQALTTPPLFKGSARRLRQEGASPAEEERGVGLIVRALERDGPLTRLHLRERLAAAGVPVDGQAMVHLLISASLRGLIVRGPMAGTHHAVVLVRDWLGAAPLSVDRDTALSWLAHRYLVGHGPAADRDLARWAGVTLGDARAGLKALDRGVVEVGEGLLDLRGRRRSITALPAPRLLGPWDPAVVGWTSREWLAGAHGGRIASGGLFRPFALVGGRAVATWSFKNGEPSLDPFDSLTPTEADALRRDAGAVMRFLARQE